MLPYCALKLKEAVPEGIPGNKLFLNLRNISYKFREIGIVIIIISLESNLPATLLKDFLLHKPFSKNFAFFRSSFSRKHFSLAALVSAKVKSEQIKKY